MFFTFPEDARGDAERQVVEIGEHRGVVRVPRRVFQRLHFLSRRSTEGSNQRVTQTRLVTRRLVRVPWPAWTALRQAGNECGAFLRQPSARIWNGLTQAGIDSLYQQIATGALVVLAVGADQYLGRGRRV